MEDLVEEVFGVGGRDLALLRPRHPDALLSEEAFARDEFMPYWAELWPSGLALARVVGVRALRGARVLELGCGLGLPSLAAAAAGGRVLATDWAEDSIALRAAQRAAQRAVGRGAVLLLDGARAARRRARPGTLVLASDVLYEERNGEALLPLLPRLIDARGEIWLADPGRPTADPFLEAARDVFVDRVAPRPRAPPGRRPPPPPERLWRMSTQREKAEELRRLHEAPEPLVLVNVWDAASARVVAAAPGCRAIATASWSIAAAHGFPDGEAITREAMIAAVGIVARAVELPVTADLERGFGDARVTIESALEAGAVGCNLEDSDGSGGLWPAEEHAAVVAAARAAGDAAGIPLVINARTDVWLTDVVPPEERVVAALERGAAYLEAGADCIFVPGVARPRRARAAGGRDGRHGERVRRARAGRRSPSWRRSASRA